MTALPEWMSPPRPEGWFAEDLDHLPEAPRHTELYDGALVFMLSPQRAWHRKVIFALESALAEQTPEGFHAIGEMSLRLDARNRPEPDVLVTNVPIENDRTWFGPSEVELAVEVVSPESAHRDRSIKPVRYAQAGIAHYWRVEEEGAGDVVVHLHDLDPAARTYVATDTVRDVLKTAQPFPIEIDIRALLS